MNIRIKGLTVEERDLIKYNSQLKQVCKKCLEEKEYKYFSCRKSKSNLLYFTYECNKCCYRRKLKVHSKNLTNYSDKQRFKENFTIEGRASMLKNRCKQRAKVYNMEYSLTKEYIIDLLKNKKCAKTGINLILDDSSYNPYAPSIDRIDNNKGYINSNIQIVCMIYNFCKNNFTEEIVDDFFNKVNRK